MTLQFLILIVAAYLLGSVPFGYIFARTKGIDLRTVGSGNIGATNVGRAIGKKFAYICFALDLLKGLLPMLVAGSLVPAEPAAAHLALWLLTGAAAILGHVFPVYLNFKGGKGVATSLGVVLGLWPWYTICGIAAFVLWAAVYLIWRYVSLASVVAAAGFVLILLASIAARPDWQLASLWPIVAFAIVIAALVIFRHRENIKRLLAGTEPRSPRPGTGPA